MNCLIEQEKTTMYNPVLDGTVIYRSPASCKGQLPKAVSSELTVTIANMGSVNHPSW